MGCSASAGYGTTKLETEGSLKKMENSCGIPNKSSIVLNGRSSGLTQGSVVNMNYIDYIYIGGSVAETTFTFYASMNI